MWSLPAVLDARARTHGDAIYLDTPETGETFTFQEVRETTTRMAGTFLSDGARPGDRVLIMAPNCAEFVLAWFSCAQAALVQVPLNTAYRGSFLEHQVSTVAPRFAVIHAAFAERFLESRSACSSIERFYVLGDGPKVAGALRQLRAAAWKAEPFDRLLEGTASPLPAVRRQDLAAILFTSGTTGLSKGVMMPHGHMYFFADECVSVTKLTDQDISFVTAPLFHGNAQFCAAYPALIAGARLVLRPKFSASRWLEQIRSSRATVTNFVGVMMDFVWQQAETAQDADNDLRCVFATPTASSADAFKKRFGIESIVEVFGLTETAMPFMTPYDARRPAGAAGLLVEDWFDVRLADPETDEEVPCGEMGELLVRPKEPWTSCLGYYGMPERTSDAFRNLWFHTGDGLRRDEEGWYYFVDRLKDAIRRRGENISSYEIEQSILEHSDIDEVAAVAVPSDVDGGEDEVMVVVVPVHGGSVTADQVWDWCDARLPYFAVPRYVRIARSLPKTPSEKVQKVQLRADGLTQDTMDRDR